MDGPRDYQTEWSKSEREKQIPYINAYVCDIWKNWYRWSYLQNRNRDRDTDIENKVVGTKVGSGGGMNWEVGIDIYTLCVPSAAQACLTLRNPMHCSPPRSSVLGDSTGKNIGMDCHAFLQGILPTQRLNPGLLSLLHWQADPLPPCHLGSPCICTLLCRWLDIPFISQGTLLRALWDLNGREIWKEGYMYM